MYRARKRPRLQFMASAIPEADEELAVARERNDELLKSRFESIFQRYEKDFSGIGDEIGVISGQIEVDNGHLLSMQDDRDTGTELAERSTFDGRLMLRAMTIAPSDCSASISDADNLLQSIEAIADSAVLCNMSSEDDLFEQEPSTDGDDDQNGLFDEYYIKRQEKSQSPSVYSSPGRRLEENATRRAISVDSLFDPGPSRSPTQTASSTTLELPELQMPEENSSHPRQIDTPAIRKQVKQILAEENQQQQAQQEQGIEPAWRIPVRISSPILATTQLPQIASAEHSPTDDVREHSFPLGFEGSVWRTTLRTRRSRKKITADKNRERIRAESEDPLQEGFSSEIEQHFHHCKPILSTLQLVNESNESATFQSRESHHKNEIQSSRYRKRRRNPLTGLKHSPLQVLKNGSMQSHRSVSNVMAQKTSALQHESPRSLSPRPDSALDEQETEHERQIRTASDDGDDSDANPAGEHSEAMSTHGGGHDEGGIPKRRRRSEEKLAESKPSICRFNTRISIKQTAEEAGKHPWQAPTTRSGKVLSRHAMSIRKTASGKFAKVTAQNQAVEDIFGMEDQEMRQIPQQALQLQELRSAAGATALKALNLGQCYYCKIKYVDRYAVGAHWDRILTNQAIGLLDKDDPHNTDFLYSMRSQVSRRNRAPSTLVRDFRRMIELHEGRNWSFDDIADLGLLQRRRPADKLEEEYSIYRQKDSASSFVWTEELEARLTSLLDDCDEKMTMYMTHRELGGISNMSYTDIGDKMAEIILAKYNDDPSMVMEHVRKLRKAHKPNAYPKKKRIPTVRHGPNYRT